MPTATSTSRLVVLSLPQGRRSSGTERSARPSSPIPTCTVARAGPRRQPVRWLRHRAAGRALPAAERDHRLVGRRRRRRLRRAAGLQLPFNDPGLFYYASSGGWPFTLGNMPWPYSTPEPLVTSGSGAPVDGVGVTFVDVDLDGTADLVAGQEDGTLLWYRNTTAAGLTLDEPVALTDATSTPIDVGGYAEPTAIDLDGDGDLDLLVYGYDGQHGLVHKVLAVTPGRANGYADGGLLEVAGEDPLGMRVFRPFAVDLDGDSLVDVLASVGDTDSVWLLRNTGTAQEPVFAVEPLLVSQTSAAHLELLDADTVRLYFALPVVAGQTTLTYHLVPSAGNPISGSLPVREQPRVRRAQGRLAPGP